MKYINIQQISAIKGSILGGILLPTIKEYFEDPKHQQEFEEWKKNRDKELKNKMNGCKR